MPVQYAGILEEHRAVRERVGLFDVSHMGEFDVMGPGALDFLQRLTPNDVGKLADGRIHYSAFLTEKGTFVDDLLVYRQGGGRVPARRQRRQHPEGLRVGERPGRAATSRSRDRSADYALIAVQGPKAAALMSRVSRPDPSDLPYYGFRDTAVFGAPTLVSRTGYTGEDGFEVYCRPDDAERLFRALLEEGKKRRRGAVRSRGARYSAPRGEDGALRQRHRRHGHGARGRPRLDRQARQGRLHRPRRPRRAEAVGRAAQARRLRDGRPRHRAGTGIPAKTAAGRAS